MRPTVSGLRAKLMPRLLKGRTDFWFRLGDLQIIHTIHASGALNAKLQWKIRIHGRFPDNEAARKHLSPVPNKVTDEWGEPSRAQSYR
jgi:transposase-like protein